MNRETGRMISVMGCGVIVSIVGLVILLVATQWASTASAREAETPPGLKVGAGVASRGGAGFSVGYADGEAEAGVVVLGKTSYDVAIGYVLGSAGAWQFGLAWASRLTPNLGSRLNFLIGYRWRVSEKVTLRWLHFSNGSLFLSTPDTPEQPNIGEDLLAFTIRF